jgi:hypothetical protein
LGLDSAYENDQICGVALAEVGPLDSTFNAADASSRLKAGMHFLLSNVGPREPFGFDFMKGVDLLLIVWRRSCALTIVLSKVIESTYVTPACAFSRKLADDSKQG